MVVGLVFLLWSCPTNLAALCWILLTWLIWEFVCGFQIGEAYSSLGHISRFQAVS